MRRTSRVSAGRLVASKAVIQNVDFDIVARGFDSPDRRAVAGHADQPQGGLIARLAKGGVRAFLAGIFPNEFGRLTHRWLPRPPPLDRAPCDLRQAWRVASPDLFLRYVPASRLIAMPLSLSPEARALQAAVRNYRRHRADPLRSACRDELR